MLVSEKRYEELEKAKRNQEYLEKLNVDSGRLRQANCSITIRLRQIEEVLNKQGGALWQQNTDFTKEPS